MSKPPCDCLNWCGDDPWLNDGRAEKCAYRKEKERREQQAADDRRWLLKTVAKLEKDADANGSATLSLNQIRRLRRATGG